MIIPNHTLSPVVFQGVVCAITCPKGGEKRGGRASTSKAPTKEAESLPSRRSGRNSKTQEETPASDPATPPQSSLSDSDSSASQSTKLAKTSQVPAKRKGKRVTNRKASGKRKATARKKSSPEVVDSPAASEEEAQEEAQEETQEEESDGSQNREKEEEEDKTEQGLDGAEGSLSDEQDGFKSSDEQEGVGPVKDVGQESEETQEQIDERIQEEKADEGESDVSCPSGSAVSSPGSCSEEVKSSKEAEEQASPVSSGENHPEKRTSPPPPDFQNVLLEDTMSPQCDEQDDKMDEQDDKMDICAESEEADNEESSKEVKAESCGSLAQPGSPSAGELEKNVADQEATASEVIVAEMPASLEPSGVDSSVEGSKDDTSVVPMDCSSPMSEHGNCPVLELPNETASPASAEPPPTTSETHVVKEERAKDKRERERSQERKNGKQRRSRFHSPTSTWSPKRDSKRETSRRSRSRSRERDGSPPSRRSSRTRSRERDRDRDGEREYSRRDRSRERRRRRSRSRSWSRSRSRSRSRTRSHRRGPSPEWPVSRDQSPQRKERRGGWRSGPGGGSGSEGRRYHGGAGHFENGVPTESSPDRQGSADNPDWVTEKIRGEADGRNRDFGYSGSSRWEDRSGNRGESRGRGGRGGFERGRGGRGSGNRSFYNQQEEMSDNRWQPRNNFSGTGNNSGNDAYSRFNENRGGGRRKESEPGEPMLDRSGWSSASSWAVRRTLPADVQDYYSKRERGPGSWNRQEEEQQQQQPDPPLQAVPGNAPVPLMNVIPPQLNVLHHYPMQGPRGALPVSLQPAAPYAMPPQVPIHLHPAVPLLQVPAVGAQGLPPPPPPPPPMQQGSQTAAVQPDGHAAQPTPSQALPSSTTQPGQHNKAQADSSKKEKVTKQQIQEKAINEVKTAIKPFYQKKEITKEEYKEIVRKAVEKVCHSKSGEVNSGKVANLVKAYVDKYKALIGHKVREPISSECIM
uniref:SR-related CTD-associated factor 11 n=1 Tax=Amphilophus citrinellus TaxID=61819 RepID=A0A3Q0SQJ8_AMPCI